MRKFLPRLLNIICFILALLVILPWNQVSLFFLDLSGKIAFFKGVSEFFSNYQQLKLFYIPAFMILISFINVFIASIDRNVKNNKVSSYPLTNLVFAPLYYFGIACCIVGFVNSIFLHTTFIIKDQDLFGLGNYINNIKFLAKDFGYQVAYVEWLCFALIQFVLIYVFKNNKKRGFFGKFFGWLLFLFMAVLSYKALTDNFNNPYISNIMDAVQFKLNATEIDIMEGFPKYILSLVAGASLLLYIILGIIAVKVNNKKMAIPAEAIASDKQVENKENIINTEVPKENSEVLSNESDNKDKENEKNDNDSIMKEIDSLVSIPKPEEVLETQIEEKTVIKQVTYENHDLDKLFNTEFNFKYCFMVKKNDSTDYYVNRTKFLTISNKGHSLSFRLELDKAIRLIIQYPLIGKDKYENHKIWFKIEDIAILSNEIVINIIKDAYETVLNNN